MRKANESCYFNLKAFLYLKYKTDNGIVHNSEYILFFNFNSVAKTLMVQLLRNFNIFKGHIESLSNYMFKSKEKKKKIETSI